MPTLDEYLDRTAADLDADIGATPLPGIVTYLGLSGTTKKLRAWYAAAIDWCNQKLSDRDFTAVPDSCVLAVYEFVRVLHHYDELQNVAVKKIKTGAREEEMQPLSGSAMHQAGMAAWPYIENYCEDITMFASGT